MMDWAFFRTRVTPSAWVVTEEHVCTLAHVNTPVRLEHHTGTTHIPG
jgi:hypothetical protein